MKLLYWNTALLCLFSLTAAAYADPPSRQPDNVIVGTYNIQFLGELPHDFAKLADVIEHFDVCGIQEVKSESAIRDLVAALEQKTSKDWGYVFGIRTFRPGGRYHEAYAAVFRRDRIELGDGLISNVWDLEEAYRNDPFVVSFKAGELDFSLLLVHTRWTDDPEGTRENEVRMLGEHLSWMAGFIPERNYIVAGDFNYAQTTPPMRALFAEAALEPLNPGEKTTFKQDFTGYASSYDHILVSPHTRLRYFEGRSAAMDVTKHVYGTATAANRRKAKAELSDHLPVWAVFKRKVQDDD